MNNRESFTFFGINHLSPHSLNFWIDYPKGWAKKYIGKTPDEPWAGLWRGKAVEDGLRHHLMGQSSACAAAYQSFDLNASVAGVTGTDEVNAERELIAPMLEQAAKWKPPGPLLTTQIKVSHFFDPIPIPIEGWIDFAFEGIDVDTKTVNGNLPSKPKPADLRQVAFYRKARSRAGGILYINTKKHAYYDVTDEDMEIGLESLRSAALALYNHLARCDTREDVIKTLPENPDHWRERKHKITVPYSDILLAG